MAEKLEYSDMKFNDSWLKGNSEKLAVVTRGNRKNFIFLFGA